MFEARQGEDLVRRRKRSVHGENRSSRKNSSSTHITGGAAEIRTRG
jgi:hypothetical protein